MFTSKSRAAAASKHPPSDTKRKQALLQRRINTALTCSWLGEGYYSPVQDSLRIEDQATALPGHRVLRLQGPLVLTTIFNFQATVRADNSRSLIIDFADVPYVDSAGIGALVGAYVTHQKDGRSLSLVGVSDRVHNALKATRVEQFFRFFDSVSAAEQASAA